MCPSKTSTRPVLAGMHILTFSFWVLSINTKIAFFKLRESRSSNTVAMAVILVFAISAT